MSPTSLPAALVPRFVHGAHKLRKGRGFSLGELKKAGILKLHARSMGIRVDERRSTVHAHNVTALTAFLTPPNQETVTPEGATEAPAVVPEAKKTAERPKRKAKRSTTPAKKRRR